MVLLQTFSSVARRSRGSLSPRNLEAFFRDSEAISGRCVLRRVPAPAPAAVGNTPDVVRELHATRLAADASRPACLCNTTSSSPVGRGAAAAHAAPLCRQQSAALHPSLFQSTQGLRPSSLPVPPCCFSEAARRHYLTGRASFLSSSGGRVDIGERVRAKQIQRMWMIVGVGGAVGVFAIVLVNSFQENLMFYITPTQALEKFSVDSSRSRFRLGGLVLEGSVRFFPNSTEMQFVVTDLATDVLVRYRGALPDLFREGQSVVTEGFLRPLTDAISAEASGRPGGAEGTVAAAAAGAAAGESAGRGVEASGGGVQLAAAHSFSGDVAEKACSLGYYFAATEVLAKHDEKYMPKEVAAALERNKASGAVQQEESSGDGAPPAFMSVASQDASDAAFPSSAISKGSSNQAPSLQMGSGPPKEVKRGGKFSKVGQAPSSAEGYEIS